jgi:hypothetical protein
VQIAGFINIADSSDYSIGIINIIRQGEKGIGVSVDETKTAMVSFRSGGRNKSAKAIAAAIAALSMALHGSVLATVLIGVSLVLGEVRYHCRRRIVVALWGDAMAAGLPMYWRVERWLRPIWWSFHALCVFSAPGSRHIRWAGIDYRVRGPQDVEVSRPPAAQP